VLACEFRGLVINRKNKEKKNNNHFKTNKQVPNSFEAASLM